MGDRSDSKIKIIREKLDKIFYVSMSMCCLLTYSVKATRENIGCLYYFNLKIYLFSFNFCMFVF